jgi:hypothetical protein
MKTIYTILLLLIAPCLQADEIFVVQLPECAAKIERRAVEADIVMVRSDCLLSVSSLIQLLDTGLHGLFPDHRLPIHSIYLGRVMDYPELSQALAKAAAKSPAWDSKHGRPNKTGESDNQRVRLLLNGLAYLQMLKPLFAQYELTACIASVEKVLIFKAKNIFTNATELPNTMSPNARLPVDAQIWLKLLPISNDCTGL